MTPINERESEKPEQDPRPLNVEYGLRTVRDRLKALRWQFTASIPVGNLGKALEVANPKDGAWDAYEHADRLNIVGQLIRYANLRAEVGIEPLLDIGQQYDRIVRVDFFQPTEETLQYFALAHDVPLPNDTFLSSNRGVLHAEGPALYTHTPGLSTVDQNSALNRAMQSTLESFQNHNGQKHPPYTARRYMGDGAVPFVKPSKL